MVNRSTQDAAQIAARRAKVAILYTRRLRQEEIAQQIGVDQSTISRDVKAIIRDWQQGAVSEVAAAKARDLGELDEIERDCALQFSQTHDYNWIDRRIKCKERRARLLGLDAPVKADLTTLGEKITITEVIVERTARQDGGTVDG